MKSMVNGSIVLRLKFEEHSRLVASPHLYSVNNYKSPGNGEY